MPAGEGRYRDPITCAREAGLGGNSNDSGEAFLDGRRFQEFGHFANRFVRDDARAFTIPSQANFFMVDCKRPVVPLIEAMKQRNVQVGRLFPAMPDHMRVSLGKRNEMESFLAAFRQVMA